MAKLGTLNDLRKRDFWRVFDGSRIEKLARMLPRLVFQHPARESRGALSQVAVLGRRQTHTNQSLYALPSPLGAAAVMERDGGGLSYILGQGVRRGRTCRHLGSGTPDARPDRRHRRR